MVYCFLNILIYSLLSISLYVNPKQNTNTLEKIQNRENIAIVYLSRTNNTRVLAEIIQKEVGGNLIPLELKNPYPDDYRTTVGQVVEEDRTGFLPPLKTKIDDIGQYDLIFVGFPTWGMQLPPPIKSFLRSYDLTGKTIIPFNTNGGYGIGSCFQQIEELCPNSKILNGFSTRGGEEINGVLLGIEGKRLTEVQKEVRTWLLKIGLMKKE
jgi:flavodoxin